MKEMNPAMKKTIVWILALAMFSTSAMALAENTPPQMPQGENGQPPEMPNGQKPGNPPDSGMGGAVYVQGDSEYTVTVGNYAETCDLTGAGEITGWDASVMPM